MFDINKRMAQWDAANHATTKSEMESFIKDFPSDYQEVLKRQMYAPGKWRRVGDGSDETFTVEDTRGPSKERLATEKELHDGMSDALGYSANGDKTRGNLTDTMPVTNVPGGYDDEPVVKVPGDKGEALFDLSPDMKGLQDLIDETRQQWIKQQEARKKDGYNPDNLPTDQPSLRPNPNQLRPQPSPGPAPPGPVPPGPVPPGGQTGGQPGPGPFDTMTIRQGLNAIGRGVKNLPRNIRWWRANRNNIKAGKYRDRANQAPAGSNEAYKLNAKADRWEAKAREKGYDSTYPRDPTVPFRYSQQKNPYDFDARMSVWNQSSESSAEMERLLKSTSPSEKFKKAADMAALVDSMGEDELVAAMGDAIDELMSRLGEEVPEDA